MGWWWCGVNNSYIVKMIKWMQGRREVQGRSIIFSSETSHSLLVTVAQQYRSSPPPCPLSCCLTPRKFRLPDPAR
jgi:hypothetical protein